MDICINSFIFDLDGVLCDTASNHYIAWKKLADQLLIPFSPEENERLKGVSRMDSLDILLSLGSKTYTADEKERLAHQKNEYYLASLQHLDSSCLLPGALEFLQQAKAEHFQTALASVSKNARLILDRLSLTPYFDCIIDGTCIKKAKPDPEVFIKALKGLSALPGQAVVLEDAVAGVTAAHRAGIRCIGIGSPSVLTEADAVMPHLGGIPPAQVITLLRQPETQRRKLS